MCNFEDCLQKEGANHDDMREGRGEGGEELTLTFSQIVWMCPLMSSCWEKDRPPPPRRRKNGLVYRETEPFLL